MIKILIADDIDIIGLKKLSGKTYLAKCQFGISNNEIITGYSDFDVLVIRSVRKIDKDLISKTNFKLIATASKGTEHIDLAFAKKKKIKIINADEGNNISAAEHTMALILSIFKKINFSDKLVRENNFRFYDYERSELFGKKIGIIGFGKVGSYVGKLCSAFGMEVYANDTDERVRLRNRNFSFRSINFLLKNSDVITIHIPLDKKNHKFISEEKLNLLSRNSVLINTSRGDVIDEKYLFKSLKNRKIKFAGLDVFSNEPNVYRGFAGLDNVLMTNHIAGKTIESRRKISDSIFEQIDKNFKENTTE